MTGKMQNQVYIQLSQLFEELGGWDYPPETPTTTNLNKLYKFPGSKNGNF